MRGHETARTRGLCVCAQDGTCSISHNSDSKFDRAAENGPVEVPAKLVGSKAWPTAAASAGLPPGHQYKLSKHSLCRLAKTSANFDREGKGPALVSGGCPCMLAGAGNGSRNLVAVRDAGPKDRTHS